MGCLREGWVVLLSGFEMSRHGGLEDGGLDSLCCEVEWSGGLHLRGYFLSILLWTQVHDHSFNTNGQRDFLSEDGGVASKRFHDCVGLVGPTRQTTAMKGRITLINEKCFVLFPQLYFLSSIHLLYLLQ